MPLCRISAYHGVCRIFLILTAAAILSGCTAHYLKNPKSETVPQYQLLKNKLSSGDRSDRLLLILAFSGGGTRAAALSYGVLEAMARIELPGPTEYVDKKPSLKRRSLLDEVDVISSVSGGSFTAAYYGLHGENIFKDFRSRFLIQNHQTNLFLSVVNPMNWPRLMSPRFGRSDLAQEYYDSVLFQNATLGDLIKGKGPAVFILATDAIDGLSFSFTPAQFSLICSDFEKFPVSRAVAASAAVPGLFTPIILRNYAGQCNTKTPTWMSQAIGNPDVTNRAYHVALRMKTYLDPESKPYIHLVDGGVSDNLGLRGFMDSIAIRGGFRESLEMAGLEKTGQVVFIIVDAATKTKAHWHLYDEIPGLGDIVRASSSHMINKYNFEIIDSLRRYTLEWSAGDLAAGRRPIDFSIIHIAFDYLPDRKEREYFQNIPTTLYLSEEQVDRLRDVAGRLLRSSETFRRLVRDLGGKIPD